MALNETKRVIYANSPLKEVICQLRFPTDLSISNQSPVEFQKAIRDLFPNYREIVEQENNIELNASEDGISDARLTHRKTPNFAFESEDGAWRVNLTANFIAFSTKQYATWEDFKSRFQSPLASFLEIYHPPFFNRVGLRYLDVIDRHNLGLSATPWVQLIKPEFLGMLSSPFVPESNMHSAAQQAEFAFDERTTMVVRSGLGTLDDSKDVCFIIDVDTFRANDISADTTIIETLDSLHVPASAFFKQAITPKLHEAMKPEPMGD